MGLCMSKLSLRELPARVWESFWCAPATVTGVQPDLQDTGAGRTTPWCFVSALSPLRRRTLPWEQWEMDREPWLPYLAGERTSGILKVMNSQLKIWFSLFPMVMVTRGDAELYLLCVAEHMEIWPYSVMAKAPRRQYIEGKKNASVWKLWLCSKSLPATLQRTAF